MSISSLLKENAKVIFFYAMLLINLINKCSTYFSAAMLYLIILSSLFQLFALLIYFKGRADLGFDMEKFCSISYAHNYLQ